MKEKLFVLLITIACAVNIVSCASPTMKTAFAPGNYVLSLNSSIINPRSAYVKLIEEKLNDEPVGENTTGEAEIRKGLYEFATLLENSGLFNSVEVVENKDKATTNQDGFLINVSLEMGEDNHTAATGGKAFASGFFTLGLVPVTANYSWSSKMTIFVLRRNVEILSTSSLKSAEASSSHSYYASSPLAERSAAREFVRNENNKAIVDYMIKNCDKIYNE